MSLTQRIAKHTSIQIAGRMVGYVLSLIYIIFITRYLGTSGFGIYTTITVFANTIAIIAEFGINEIFVKEFYASRLKNKIAHNAFSLKVFSTLAIFLIGLLISFLFPYGGAIRLGIFVFAWATILGTIGSFFIQIFQMNMKMQYQVISELAGRILAFILIIISIYTDSGIMAILASFVIGAVLQFALAYGWARKLSRLRFSFDFSLWKKIFVKAIPLGISAALFFIYYKVDTIILSVLRPSYDVGIYGASYKVIDIIITFPAMFCGLIFPILTACYAANKIKRFNQLIQKSFDVLLFTGLGTSIILYAMARPIILIIAGNSFEPSVLVLKILSFAALLLFINSIFLNAIIGGDRQAKIILPSSLLAIFNIVINLILIPKYSYLGAAVATLITQFIAMIVPWAIVSRDFKTKISFKSAFKAILAGAIMFVIFLLIKRYGIITDWNNLENISTYQRLVAFLLATAAALIPYLGIFYLIGGLPKSTFKKVVGQK